MPTSSGRMGWPVPDEGVDPWYDAFLGLVGAVDTSGFASRENAGILMTGGGQLSLNSTTGVMTWQSDINIFAPITGYLWTLPGPEITGGGTVTIQNGQVLYVNLNRAPTGNTTLGVLTASQIPNTDNAFLLGIRIGTKVYFRNGAVLTAGSPADVIDNPGGAIGSAGQLIRRSTAMAINEATSQSTYVVGGDFQLNPADYALSSLNTNIYFLATASVTRAALTGQVILQDLTSATQVAQLTFTGNVVPSQQITTALTLTSAAHMYEVRYYVTGGAGGSDQILLAWAGFQIDQVVP